MKILPSERIKQEIENLLAGANNQATGEGLLSELIKNSYKSFSSRKSKIT